MFVLHIKDRLICRSSTFAKMRVVVIFLLCALAADAKSYFALDELDPLEWPGQLPEEFLQHNGPLQRRHSDKPEKALIFGYQINNTLKVETKRITPPNRQSNKRKPGLRPRPISQFSSQQIRPFFPSVFKKKYHSLQQPKTPSINAGKNGGDQKAVDCSEYFRRSSPMVVKTSQKKTTTQQVQRRKNKMKVTIRATRPPPEVQDRLSEDAEIEPTYVISYPPYWQKEIENERNVYENRRGKRSIFDESSDFEYTPRNVFYEEIGDDGSYENDARRGNIDFDDDEEVEEADDKETDPKLQYHYFTRSPKLNRQAPYHGAVLIDDQFACGASLISTLLFLTSMACVKGVEPSRIKVRVGSDFHHDWGIVYEVDEVEVEGTDDLYHLALLRSSQEVLTDRVVVRPIKLVDRNDQDLGMKSIAQMSGWGVYNCSPPYSHAGFLLEHATVSMTDVKDIEKQAWWHEIHKKQERLCSKGQTTTCIADLGGPLVRDNKLVGVVSNAQPCSIGMPIAFINVKEHLPWIFEKTAQLTLT